MGLHVDRRGIAGGEERDGRLGRPGQAGDLGGEQRRDVALGGDQDAVAAHDDVARELGFHVEPLPFLGGALPSGEGSTQQRGSGHRGGHRHQHDDGVGAIVQDAE